MLAFSRIAIDFYTISGVTNPFVQTEGLTLLCAGIIMKINSPTIFGNFLRDDFVDSVELSNLLLVESMVFYHRQNSQEW